MTAVSPSMFRLVLLQCSRACLTKPQTRLLVCKTFCSQSPLLSLFGKASESGTDIFRSKWIHTGKTVTLSSAKLQYPVRFVHNTRCNKTVSEEGRRTVGSVCERWNEKLEGKNIAEPRVSVEYIVAYVLGKKTLHGIEAGWELTEQQVKLVDTLCHRRLLHEPVQYILGEWDFDDIELKLRSPVFIPRPETEELVGLAAERIRRKTSHQHPGCRLLELCCRSGAITLALLHRFPQLQAVAVDVSPEACLLTEENAQRLGLTDRLTVVQGRVGDDTVDNNLQAWTPFDILVSNPPYIPSSQLSTLEPQILLYEDLAALDGGTDGLTVVRDILKLSPHLLKNDSDILLEIQPGQPNEIRNIVSDVKESHLNFVSSYNDYLGRERFCHLRSV